MERLFNLDAQLLFDACVMALSMLVMFTFLSYLLFKPVRKLLEDRKQRVADEQESAKNDRKEAAVYKEEYEQKLKEIDKEAQAILSEARKKAMKTENEIVAEAKEEAAAETIDEVKAEDTAETIDEEKEVSKEPAEDKVAEESDEDEEPVFDVSDFLTIIKQDQAKKKELENQLAEVEKRAKQNTLLREKTKAEESFEQEKGVLDKALAMEIISKEEYEQKRNIARKKVENFEEIKKIEQQFEMGIITKEEKDEKINAILNA